MTSYKTTTTTNKNKEIHTKNSQKHSQRNDNNDMSLGVTYHSTNVTLSLYKEEVITSPGYPYRDYEKDTNYTWDVRADAATEEISINITIDIHQARGYGCYDYLLIQGINPSLGYFTAFKRCGKLTTYRTVRGNRLLVTFVSDRDNLTSRGFQLKIKVLKVGTITTTTSSTPSTTTIHVPTKARTNESTLKTTVLKVGTITTTTASTPSTTTIHVPTKARTNESTLKTTAVPLTTNTTAKVQTSSTTTPSTTTAKVQTSSTTTPSTTTAKVHTSSTTTPSTTTTSTTTPSTTTTLTTTPSTTTTSTTTSTPKLTTQAMSLTTPLTRKTTMTPNTNATTSIKSESPLTSTATRSALITSDVNVILLIGLGVLEVTLVVVGVLAVQRYRRKRKYYPSRQVKKRNGDHTNALGRQNSCRETHVYDEIEIDDVKEKEEEECQYKELSEGVYDTTLKRRSHLKVVGERISNYSRGSIINMFRTSSFFKRKVNETSVMTFSTFKGPVQSQIGEKK